MELGEIINVVTKEIIDNGKYMFMSIVNIGNKLHFYKYCPNRVSQQHSTHNWKNINIFIKSCDTCYRALMMRKMLNIEVGVKLGKARQDQRGIS